MRTVKVGIGGPVGSGKTLLIDVLCKRLRDDHELAVITNDIYTYEDAEFLVRSGALSAERILGVQTGGCPHTAIRDDTSINQEAIERMLKLFPATEILFIESGGDNLAASFSPEMVDIWIYIIDVAEGEKIPRKGGPGIVRSDLLIINKIDLAPYVGADLSIMDRDARKQRGTRPFIFTNLKSGEGVEPTASWLVLMIDQIWQPDRPPTGTEAGRRCHSEGSEESLEAGNSIGRPQAGTPVPPQSNPHSCGAQSWV